MRRRQPPAGGSSSPEQLPGSQRRFLLAELGPGGKPEDLVFFFCMLVSLQCVLCFVFVFWAVPFRTFFLVFTQEAFRFLKGLLFVFSIIFLYVAC